jgi:hypothetical protein
MVQIFFRKQVAESVGEPSAFVREKALTVAKRNGREDHRTTAKNLRELGK